VPSAARLVSSFTTVLGRLSSDLQCARPERTCESSKRRNERKDNPHAERTCTAAGYFLAQIGKTSIALTSQGKEAARQKCSPLSGEETPSTRQPNRVHSRLVDENGTNWRMVRFPPRRARSTARRWRNRRRLGSSSHASITPRCRNRPLPGLLGKGSEPGELPPWKLGASQSGQCSGSLDQTRMYRARCSYTSSSTSDSCNAALFDRRDDDAGSGNHRLSTSISQVPTFMA